MMRAKVIIAGQVVCLTLIVFSLYLGRDRLTRLRAPSFGEHSNLDSSATGTGLPDHTAVSTIPFKSATLSGDRIATYIDAIVDANSTVLPRLECPSFPVTRYEYLKLHHGDSAHIQYFFALDLRQCVDLLPRLIGSVVEAIRFLGPRQCALSIIEGPSNDGTGEVLAALRPALDALTTTYYFNSTSVSSKVGDRIARLAELRNMALQPMLDDDDSRYSANTTVIFLNDVAICLDDILELVHQRQFLGADMTCAMDWTYVGPNATFYDVWVARTLRGDAFFDIPPDGNWNSAWNLFWNDAESQSRFTAHQPFQVFSCWNGAVTFTAKPIIEKTITFRAARTDAGECFQGEPMLFAKDLWFHGYNKIATIPAVNLEYTDANGKRIKDIKGYTSRLVGEGHSDEKIEWQLEPPAQVRCQPNWENQFWQPWNTGLT